MRRNRLVAALAALALTAAYSALSAAPAAAQDGEYFVVKGANSVASGDRLYLVAGTPEDWASTGAPKQYLTYEAWSALGSPSPVVWPVDRYASLPWSDGIYWEINWPDGETWAGGVTYEQWVVAGRPTPVDDLRLCKLGIGCDISRWATSGDLYLTEYQHQSLSAHRLTYGEWEALGFPAVTTNRMGVYKLPWTDAVFQLDPSYIGPRSQSTSNVLGVWCGAQLSYSEWQHFGSPAPQTVASTTVDRFIVNGQPGWVPDDWIFYDGPAGYFHVSAAQWAAAGSPAPTAIIAPVLPENQVSC
ncbi:hypothetical protein L1785_03945 [Antribacter sp. KLBMP9083]|uniref:Secreted protein n=1 Tax=Antribacter soli TaxID=2910976 RepID=A0AA41QAZ4_9MICO|nr:hypothetical protein [Antribacter soli]MCF4120123.1 hypothetical protein [Antribacter soli]